MCYWTKTAPTQNAGTRSRMTQGRRSGMPAKTFSIMGDSISTFEGCVPDGYTLFYNDERLERSGVLRPTDTWWSHAARALGGTVLADSAWSGSMVEGAGFPAASSPERAAALLGPDGQAPDAVLVFIGINDYGWGGAEAQAAGRSHAMPRCIDPATVPEQIAGAAPADAAERFAAAYRTMLRNIRAAAPEAAVYCITLLPGRTHGVDHPEFCYRLRGHHLDEYNAAIRDAAAAEGCRVADVRAFGRDYDSLEGTHPTNLGMRQFASMVVRAMQLADAGASASGADASASGAEAAGASVADAAGAGATSAGAGAAGAGAVGADVAETSSASVVKADATSAGAAKEDVAEGITAEAQPEIANPALDLRDFCGAPKSVQLCDAPTCIGCPHAANTGNQWLCRCLK